MSLTDQLDLARANFNRCRTNLEQALHGASTAWDYYAIEVRAEKLKMAANSMSLTLEQIELEQKNVIV